MIFNPSAADDQQEAVYQGHAHSMAPSVSNHEKSGLSVQKRLHAAAKFEDDDAASTTTINVFQMNRSPLVNKVVEPPPRKPLRSPSHIATVTIANCIRHRFRRKPPPAARNALRCYDQKVHRLQLRRCEAEAVASRVAVADDQDDHDK